MATKKPRKPAPKKVTVHSSTRQNGKRPKKITEDTKQIAADRHPLPSVLSLTVSSAQTIWRHKQLFAGIIIIYGILNLLLVHGLANSANVINLRYNIATLDHGHLSGLTSGLSTVSLLFSGGGSSASATAGLYQVLLILIVSLAIIWALRQSLADNPVSIRDSYYKSMYPLIPFVLLILLIGVELIPLLITSFLYSTVVANGVAVHAFEQILWFLFFLLGILWSGFMLIAALMSLYIVTLPDMRPIQALKSARQLVKGRRLRIARKLLFFPVLVTVVGCLVLLPTLYIATILFQITIYLFSLLVVLAFHSYAYSLYRELL